MFMTYKRKSWQEKLHNGMWMSLWQSSAKKKDWISKILLFLNPEPIA